MPLSWNEIRARAAVFSKDWKDAHYEKGETQSFYNDFFNVFGRRRRDVAVYEEKVKKLNDKSGFIDLFWPGYLLVEQKSVGRSLQAARDQATDYFLGLSDKEKPRYILLSDFQTFEFLDLEENTEHSFTLAELPEKIRLFDFIAGYQQQKYQDQDPVNIEASELMSNLHNKLEESGYKGTSLERLLVRIMFCLFADDTGIFQPDSFLRYIEDQTIEDGSDTGSRLIHLFQVLDTNYNERQSTLDENMAEFPFVNGELFAETIRTPSFNTSMRDALLRCCYFNWSKVSPALFGSLFQTVMLPEEQRQGGAHYTSEKNILKTLQPLFLDELREEFEKIKVDRSTQKKSRLKKLKGSLSEMRFFDPACGCGNFLILAYRELRQLEIEILEEMYPLKERQTFLDISHLSNIDVDQFYGIEMEEFPVRISEVAMWLVDHQMNMKLSSSFGQAFVRLPLQKSAHIVHGNALTLNWNRILPSSKCTYILSNPPFVGYSYRTKEQATEIDSVFSDLKGSGVLDYVCGWYGIAANYIQNTKCKVAFVSTNSISQGEQPGILWSYLFEKKNIKIHFAHQTFKWTIDEKRAKGMNIAAVYVVIIGFAAHDTNTKYIYEYETLTSDPHKIKVSNINPYLVEGGDTAITKTRQPICSVPKMNKGSQPTDGGFLLLSNEEFSTLIAQYQDSKALIRRFVGSNDFLKGEKRYCLWLKDVAPSRYRHIPAIMERIESVRRFRLKSKKETTRKAASVPYLFTENRQPEKNYLLIPRVSSERRPYIPIGFFDSNVIVSDAAICLPDATLYHFGVLTSEMHMAWVRYVGGRLKSDYRYSNTLVYNNFPWPEPNEKQKKAIEEKTQAVLEARKQFPDSTLADIYDPNTMPSILLKAHRELDKAVDKAYRKTTFKNEKERIEFLFELYQQKTEPLVIQDKKRKKSK